MDSFHAISIIKDALSPDNPTRRAAEKRLGDIAKDNLVFRVLIDI